MAETARGGPFPEILDGMSVTVWRLLKPLIKFVTVDIFINCIYLSSSIPPFVTNQTVQDAGKTRRLSIIADVSCDTTNPFNPIPVYNTMTTFDAPTVEAEVGCA